MDKEKSSFSLQILLVRQGIADRFSFMDMEFVEEIQREATDLTISQCKINEIESNLPQE